MNRRLYRCSHDRRLAGVAAGLAEYLDLDVTLVRVLWFVSIFFGGFGLLLYVVMALVVPLEPGSPWVDPRNPPPPAPSGHDHAVTRDRSGNGALFVFLGAALVLFGSLALLDDLLPDWANGGRFVAPAFILGVGVLLLVGAARRRTNAP